MRNTRRRILTCTTQNQYQNVLIFHTSDGENLEYKSYSVNDIEAPKEWKDLYGTIEICEGVVSIKRMAFYEFKASVYIIPQSLRRIGARAFMRSSVAEIDFTQNENVVIEGSAFAFCEQLTSLHFPAATTNIGADLHGGQSGMCDGCSALQTVTFGADYVYIGQYAFQSCTRLNISSLSVRDICENAFHSCTSLTDLTIHGNTVTKTTIKSQAFTNCRNLTEVRINGVKDIETYAFSYCNNLRTLHINESCYSLHSSAFYACTGLTDIYLGFKQATDNVYNYVGENNTFNGCTGIKNIYLKDLSVLSDLCGGESIFTYSTQTDKKIHLRVSTKPDIYEHQTIITIDSGTVAPRWLAGCDTIYTISLPETITEIPEGAFSGCRFGTVKCLALQPPTLANNEFGDIQEEGLSGIRYINVPEESVDLYKQADGWSMYADIIQAI